VVNRGKEDKKVARGATLYSKKDLDRKKRKPKKPQKTSRNSIEQGTLPIYHSVPDPDWEDKVIDLIGKSGIEVASYKKRYIIRRIRVRMGRLKLNSYQDYFNYVRKNSHEIREIQEALSINVTRFFRNRDTYDLIKTEILPQVILHMKKQKQNELKFWSAGCAVGAEPYTLAMISSEAVPPDIHVNIQATDVKNELLHMARNAIYSEPYLAEMTDGEIHKYFIQHTRDEFEVASHIKRLVSFSRHDLMKDQFPSNLDIISCRNVLIYVDRHAQMEIITKFFDALKPGGILILGRTETLFGDWRRHVDIISTKHRIYQKKSGSYLSPVQRQDAKTKRKSSVSKKSHSKRLSDLRNFREVYEERRKAWIERLERQKHRTDRIRGVERTIPSGRPTSQRKVHLEKKKLGSQKNYRKLLDQDPKSKNVSQKRALIFKKQEQTSPSDASTLTSYRSKLKKSMVPPKIAQVRTDLKSEKDRLTDVSSTPESVYRRLKKMREERERKKQF
jgi:chemotaxis methyl-accepting protein methylase